MNTIQPQQVSSATTTTTPTTTPTTTSKADVGSSQVSALRGKEGVCRIEVSRVDWIYEQPWQRSMQSKSSGSGFVIAGRRILTNAHVVQSAVDIRVRKHGSTRRFPAVVVVYAPDVDLAILQIVGTLDDQRDFFRSGTTTGRTNIPNNGNDNSNNEQQERQTTTESECSSLALQFANDLPALQESVHVVGFPTGGRTICITEGVVSRIDMVSVSTFNSQLAIQIDAAINPGNSGGPAFNARGQVTGVAFCKHSKAANTDNIGYLIPVDVVRAFLGRIEKTTTTTTTTTTSNSSNTNTTTTTNINNNDKQQQQQRQQQEASYIYTLSPSIPYRWHALENKSLRLYHNVPETVHGVLLTSVCESVRGALQEGDVLTKIDGRSLADDGQVVLRGDDELIQHRYMLRGKRVDEPTVFSVFRNGHHVECPPCILRDIPSICLRWPNVDYPPDYVILGALVLLPLSWGLRSSKKCGTRLVSDCIDWCHKWPSQWEGKEGLVVLTAIFSHELSFSYSRPWRRVVAYNGTPVLSLKHLRDLWEASCAAATAADAEDGTARPSFARIELENDEPVVFEVKAAMEAQSAILETHQIPKASHISPPNPKYN